jgi:single-stranded DNA-binding protein
MEEFGIFAKQLKVKVSNAVKKFDKVWRIPCSMGFKQQDKTYVNEWVDLVVFSDLFQDCEGIEKGDYLTVFGRLTLTEWSDKKGDKKKSWQILCSEIRTDKPKGQDREQPPLDSVPF